MITLGRVIATKDRAKFDDARGWMQKGLGLFGILQIKPQDAKGLLRLEEICAEVGRKKTAVENLNKVEEMFQEMGIVQLLAKNQKV